MVNVAVIVVDVVGVHVVVNDVTVNVIVLVLLLLLLLLFLVNSLSHFLPAQPMLLLLPHSVFVSQTKLMLSLMVLLHATCCHLPMLFPLSLITTQF